MTPVTKEEAGQLVAEMGTDYRKAKAALAEARNGLIAAISDAKVHDWQTGELVKLSGWSPAQIKGIAAYSVATKATPTSQQAEHGSQAPDQSSATQ